MRRRSSAAAAILLVAACTRGSPDPTASANANANANANASANANATANATATANPDAGEGEADDDAYATAGPRGGRSIGHTSVVFKIELVNGKKCAWKPASRRGGKRYRGEIAARRLGLALGIPNVPRAMPRVFRDAELRSVLPELYANEAIVEGGVVHGALIPWIEKLEFLSFESDTKWKTWLRRGQPIPDDQRAIAADMSTLVAFDFLTGNWDRWSGGNIGFDRARGRVLFIDNDGAFFEIVPKDALARSRRLLADIDRFSKSFVEHLRALDDTALASAIGDETTAPLLSTKALAGVTERRAELLRLVDAKLADAGDTDTLFFR